MTQQAQNNYNLCKGQPKEKILTLWKMGNVKQSVIDDLAAHYKISSTREAVAEALSKDK